MRTRSVQDSAMIRRMAHEFHSGSQHEAEGQELDKGETCFCSGIADRGFDLGWRPLSEPRGRG